MSRLTIARHVFAIVAVVTAVVALSPSQTGQAVETRTIMMHDACSPSFNDAVGPGTCNNVGGVPFERFIQVLMHAGSIGAWAFDPGTVRVTEGTAFQAWNAGGEVHTFTEVDEFGGGFIPLLNDLSGNPEPAPECVAPGHPDIPNAALEFIPPGGKSDAEVEEPGTVKYQCCIHPWMRTDIVVR
jgi:plastocyanin